jgi:hypothetical protein
MLLRVGCYREAGGTCGFGSLLSQPSYKRVIGLWRRAVELKEGGVSQRGVLVSGSGDERAY